MYVRCIFKSHGIFMTSGILIDISDDNCGICLYMYWKYVLIKAKFEINEFSWNF